MLNEIAQSDFKLMKVADMRAAMPCLLMCNGEPMAIIAPVEDVIVVSDLHPRVRNSLRAQEKRARVGMPTPDRLRPRGAPSITEEAESEG